MKRIRWASLPDAARAEMLARPRPERTRELRRTVARILGQVRRDGDDALRTLTARLDRVEVGAFEVSPDEKRRARETLSPELRGALTTAIETLTRFHEARSPRPVAVETAPGVRCEVVHRPVRAVGLYVPAGTAPLPSTALMLGVPARVAGCPVRVAVTPPRPDGSVDPTTLVALDLVGVERVFRVGGAQAIGALAWGTASIPRVDLVCGPGNRFVTEAKRQVCAHPGGPGSDLPAGPSELLVVADGSADPEVVAADLLSQAEHGVDSQVLLVTADDALAGSVLAAIDDRGPRLPRWPTARRALEASVAVIVDDLGSAADVVNAYAPEHLSLQVRDPRGLLGAIDRAGSVFLGPAAPEAIGDYVSGTNHVLPTGGAARYRGGLSVSDFLVAMTVQTLTPEGLAGLGPSAIALARAEGLDGHAEAIRVRLEATVGGRAR